MKRNVCLAAVGLMFLVGCGDSHEAVIKDQLALMEDMNAVLADIKDVETAKAAQPKLQSLADRAEKIKARADKLGEPSNEVQEQLKEKYASESKSALRGLMGNMMRVRQIEGVKEQLDKVQRNMAL